MQKDLLEVAIRLASDKAFATEPREENISNEENIMLQNIAYFLFIASNNLMSYPSMHKKY